MHIWNKSSNTITLAEMEKNCTAMQKLLDAGKVNEAWQVLFSVE